MFEKSFPQSVRPTLREISPEFGCRSPLRASSERNFPQNCDAHLAESLFSNSSRLPLFKKISKRNFENLKFKLLSVPVHISQPNCGRRTDKQAFPVCHGWRFPGDDGYCCRPESCVEFIAFFEAADFSEEGATTDRGHVKSFFQSNRGLGLVHQAQRSLETWMASAIARNMERENPPATSVPRPT